LCVAHPATNSLKFREPDYFIAVFKRIIYFICSKEQRVEICINLVHNDSDLADSTQTKNSIYVLNMYNVTVYGSETLMHTQIDSINNKEFIQIYTGINNFTK